MYPHFLSPGASHYATFMLEENLAGLAVNSEAVTSRCGQAPDNPVAQRYCVQEPQLA